MSKKNKKIVIGLVLEDIFTDFAKDVIQSVIKNIPVGRNIEVVVIAGKFEEIHPHDINASQTYKTVYNSIYRLENICKFDGFLVALGSMNKVREQFMNKTHFTGMENIPKVFMVSDSDEVVSVNYDNETGIREAVDYLVNVEGLTKFGMLGGRDDNLDAQRRKSLYITSIIENGQKFDERAYQSTDMSTDCEKEALRLVSENRDLQAIFCVNDAVAVGLYKALKKYALVPGKDVKVFGFDNTRLAGEMTPSLATIGAEGETLGQRALNLLLDMLAGNEVKSAKIPTKLYGAESFDYEMYRYSTLEMINVNESFIYRMFDDCFYRYRYEIIDSKDVNLKRLFYEFMSRILFAVKNRYLSMEEYEEIMKLIDIFFENGAMDYTDASKLVKSLEKFQGAVNEVQKKSLNSTSATNVFVNRLFVHMRNRIILTVSKRMIEENNETKLGNTTLQNFLIECTDLSKNSADLVNILVRNFDRLGLYNAGLFMFENPVIYEKDSVYLYPDEVLFRCYVKSGKLFVMPEERQKCSMQELFRREELTSRYKAYYTFPIVFKDYVYGILVTEATKHMSVRGEYVSDQLGRAIYINHTQETEYKDRKGRTYNQIAEALASKYDSIYYVNSVNGEYVLYKADEIMRNLHTEEHGGDFFTECSMNADLLIHPEDRKKFKQLFVKDNLLRSLDERKTNTLEYRLIVDNIIHNMRLVILWSSDKIHFIVGVENIDEEKKKEAEQVQALTSARELARRDDLTGIRNKNAYREFEETIQRKIDEKDVQPFALVVCDINNLKVINDTKGHQAGDEYIKASCMMICDMFSHSPVFRIGGDEFVVVLSNEDYINRNKILKKMRNAVIQNLKKEDGIVVASGMSEFDPTKDKKITQVFDRADSLMYENKNFLKFI